MSSWLCISVISYESEFSFAKVFGDLPRQPSCAKREQSRPLPNCAVDKGTSRGSAQQFLRMEICPSMTDLGSNAFPGILKI